LRTEKLTDFYGENCASMEPAVTAVTIRWAGGLRSRAGAILKNVLSKFLHVVATETEKRELFQ